MSLQSIRKYRFLLMVSGALFMLMGLMPVNASADDEVDTIKRQLELMNKQMDALQKKLEEMEKTPSAGSSADLKEMDERLNKV